MHKNFITVAAFCITDAFYSQNNNEPLNFQELIIQCLSENPDAQKLLFNRFVTPMARVCIRYLKDHSSAQDALMEGFMKVFDKLGTFDYQGEHSLAVWIRKIMINECLMKLRKDRGRFFMDVQDQHLEPEERLTHQAAADDILALVKTLPAGYRTVFNLYAIDGYSHREIATLLNITESASRSQLTHARTRLKELLQQHGWS